MDREEGKEGVQRDTQRGSEEGAGEGSVGEGWWGERAGKYHCSLTKPDTDLGNEHSCAVIYNIFQG